MPDQPEELKTGIEWMRIWSAERRRLRRLEAEHGPTVYYAVRSQVVESPTPSERQEAKAKRQRKVDALMRAQDGRCYLCDGEFGPDLSPTIEHVTPRAARARSCRNILLACEPCNGEKASRMPTPRELAYLNEVNRLISAELWPDITRGLKARA